MILFFLPFAVALKKQPQLGVASEQGGMSSVATPTDMGGESRQPAEWPDVHVLEPLAPAEHGATIVFLHGVGGGGQEARDFFATFRDPTSVFWRRTRMVFPTARLHAVTRFGGEVMSSWYDITGVGSRLDEPGLGVQASAAYVHRLLDVEAARMPPLTTSRPCTERNLLYLAGFSQGAALTLFSGHTYRGRLLDGVFAFSGYIFARESFLAMLEATEGATSTSSPGRDHRAARLNVCVPCIMCHGRADDVVLFEFGEASFKWLGATRRSLGSKQRTPPPPDDVALPPLDGSFYDEALQFTFRAGVKHTIAPFMLDAMLGLVAAHLATRDGPGQQHHSRVMSKA